ncbi:MAG: hypothetical protein JSV49_04765 [Thermoplasmata archaeon]|nr:MAG: hypothetical protein JSV49_04765 [Thermoplasmata archaeon]
MNKEYDKTDIITLDDFKTALQNRLGSKGISDEHITKLAEYIMNFFGHDDYVEDNKLKTKDRDVFYMLEEEGFLSTMREEVTLQKGKVWRIHYWKLKKDFILKSAKKIEVEETEDEYDIYEDLSDDVWHRHERGDSPQNES